MNQDASGAGLRLDRRRLGVVLAGTAAAAALPSTLVGSPASAQPATTTVRVGTVQALQTGGLLDGLVAAFEATSDYQVTVSVGSHAAVFTQARAGAIDLALTHFGVDQVRQFVSEGLGRWPQLLLSTSFVLIGPSSDPARICHIDDLVVAFRKIAHRRLPFIVNDLAQPRFVTDTLWYAVGQPDRQGWLVDTGLRGPAAVEAAAAQGGYTIWGLHPFLMFQQQRQLDVQGLTYCDSLMSRGIASVVVNPDPARPVNLDGALALEGFLLSPETQALIRGVRHPDFDGPIFWPAAIHNGNE